ncbi:MAG: hypothetical protein WC804_17930 [Sphingomonas sp.]|jgi:hypothetical protein|uniref:hypothetical protein n=1 Tax=Sphingomonas sp. TaxID=28214 RepID=UPI0035628E12
MTTSDQIGATVARHRTTWRGRWFAVVVATLLAFVGQAFVTQTHLHVASSQRSDVLASLSGGATDLKTGPTSPDLPICPICREIAHAGAYLAPTPIAFPAPEPVAVGRVVLPALALTPRQDSHGWRSRAPPLNLHA